MTEFRFNVVDSCGWLEYFAGSPEAENYAKFIEEPEKLIVPTICIHEVFKVILREKSENDSLLAISLMYQSKIVPLDDEISLLSARLSVSYKIPTADSIVLATANIHKARLYTQDKHLKDLPGVVYFEKKKS